jgi:hypothetical protein
MHAEQEANEATRADNDADEGMTGQAVIVNVLVRPNSLIS